MSAFQTGPFSIFYDTHHGIHIKLTTIQSYVSGTYSQILNTTVEFINVSDRKFYHFNASFATNAPSIVYVTPSTYSHTLLEPGYPNIHHMVINNTNYNPSLFTPVLGFAISWSHDHAKSSPDVYFGNHTDQLPDKNGHCPGPSGTKTCGIHIPLMKVYKTLQPKIAKPALIGGPVSGFWDYSNPSEPFIFAPDRDEDTAIEPYQKTGLSTISSIMGSLK